MSSHRREKEKQLDDYLDGLIRWALHDSVAGAEPSSQVWERIRQQAANEPLAAMPPPSSARRILPRRLWLTWLMGAGAHNLVPGYPRLAEQQRLYAFDMRAAQSVVRLVECTMPVLRLVA